MKVALFTAANEKYFDLLEGMLESLNAQLDKKIKRLTSIDVYAFNDGFNPTKHLPCKVIDVRDYDLHRHYPEFKEFGRSVNSMALRPLLPLFCENLPDVIIWVDSDIWFQNKKGLEDMIWASNHGTIAIVPQVDRLTSYVIIHEGESFATSLFQYYGEEAVITLQKYPLLNNGFFAADFNSLVWNYWRESLNLALNNNEGKFEFGLDQLSLNHAIYHNNLSFVPLPFSHNYNARLATTSLINGKLCFNAVPFEEIQTVHLVGDAKWSPKTLMIRNEEGEFLDTITTKLDYKSIQKLNKENI